MHYLLVVDMLLCTLLGIFTDEIRKFLFEAKQEMISFKRTKELDAWLTRKDKALQESMYFFYRFACFKVLLYQSQTVFR